MNRKELIAQIREKGSFLCVGLDSDINKIPEFLLDYEDPVFEFNKKIIEATKDYSVCYKINIAFYEALGKKGWDTLEKTVNIIPPGILKIADAKRGDIGNTSYQYARAFFESMPFDAITVAPYMGQDSISPFLEFKDKWVIILALTSNKGSNDFQFLDTNDNRKLYEQVILKSSTWGSTDNIMYVVGATHPESFKHIRALIPDHFLLIPGVGTQGGDLEKIAINAINEDIGILVNVSRAIIFPEVKEGFPTNCANQAKLYASIMKKYIH
jgi:orotidine-5'-phosphate decarboxylase